MFDLEIHNDRQLPNIRGVVEESVGSNREAIKLITKVLPSYKHYVGTTYGISEDSYGGINSLLGGTGKGNAFQAMFVEMFHVSCLKK